MATLRQIACLALILAATDPAFAGRTAPVGRGTGDYSANNRIQPRQVNKVGPHPACRLEGLIELRKQATKFAGHFGKRSETHDQPVRKALGLLQENCT